ncbi:MAG: radical SAM protein [Candidatus Omnitrophica bacterium]|nr:radical SAM protein [Candidatus Omnitrophota bacterium]
MSVYPAYLESFQNGYLDNVIETLNNRLNPCSICPRKCGVNRVNGELGFCKTGLLPRVYSFMRHQGEEPPISGTNGSGTIFFSNCNMGCIYCQNYEFSQLGQGREVSLSGLAGFMLELQEMGCHNINLVTPTHILPQILSALKIAIAGGLRIPLVYNTGGYELAGIIGLLEGIIDIYLADMRYGDSAMSLKYSFAPDYPEYNQQAIKEMRRQIDKDEIGKDGIMKRGLIIRHLVIPENTSGTDKVMHFIFEELSTETLVSLMSQYLPYYKAAEDKHICRRLKLKEYEDAKEIMEKYGLHNGWVQDSFGQERFAGVNIKSVLKKDG